MMMSEVDKKMEEDLAELNRGRNEQRQSKQESDLANKDEDKYDLGEITISKSCLEPILIDSEKEIMKFLQSGILKGQY